MLSGQVKLTQEVQTIDVKFVHNEQEILKRTVKFLSIGGGYRFEFETVNRK